jgi:hypothetical protein
LLDEIMRFLRPAKARPTIRWMDSNLALGLPAPLDGWHAVRARGVQAVVDLNEECNVLGGTVRDAGMRYLRLPVSQAGVPEVEELHIVASWALERIAEGGSVLVHEGAKRGNDALVACAVLVKDGVSLARALSRLRRISDVPLTETQMGLLHQFVAQRVVASGGG